MHSNRYAAAALALAGMLAIPAHAIEVTPQQPAARPQQPTTGWIAFAASQNGRVFRHDGGTESSSKATAQTECENKTLRSCNAISVQTQTDVAIVHCRAGSDSDSFLGGSNQNMGGARWLAMNKAQNAGYSPGDCSEIFTY